MNNKRSKWKRYSTLTKMNRREQFARKGVRGKKPLHLGKRDKKRITVYELDKECVPCHRWGRTPNGRGEGRGRDFRCCVRELLMKGNFEERGGKRLRFQRDRKKKT